MNSIEQNLMSDTLVRAAIVGTGYIADFHARAIREAEGVELAATCDANLRRAQSFAKARFLTVQEVEDLMRVSSMTVYRLIKAGDLPAVRVGRSFRVSDSDVDAYLAARYTQAG